MKRSVKKPSNSKPEGWNSYHYAAREGNMDGIARLVSKGLGLHELASITTKTKDSVLHIAAEHDQMEVAEYLLTWKSYVDVNALNVYGETPLDKALQNNYDMIAKFLIDNGGCINKYDPTTKRRSNGGLNF